MAGPLLYPRSTARGDRERPTGGAPGNRRRYDRNFEISSLMIG
jgi:hypothetical protein